MNKIAILAPDELSMLKQGLVENSHPRFMKEFSFLDPYGKSKFYKEAVENGRLGKNRKTDRHLRHAASD